MDRNNLNNLNMFQAKLHTMQYTTTYKDLYIIQKQFQDPKSNYFTILHLKIK